LVPHPESILLEVRLVSAADEKVLRGLRVIQRACDRCTQGVMDADGPNGPGNDHLYGRCACSCHAPLEQWERAHQAAGLAEAASDIVRQQFDQRRFNP